MECSGVHPTVWRAFVDLSESDTPERNVDLALVFRCCLFLFFLDLAFWLLMRSSSAAAWDSFHRSVLTECRVSLEASTWEIGLW